MGSCVASCCGVCCSSDGLPGGGDYKVRRSANYDQISIVVSTVGSTACQIFDTLSRTSTNHGKKGEEPPVQAHAFNRKCLLCKARCLDDVDSNPEQFADEVHASTPEVRQRDLNRVREWMDAVLRISFRVSNIQELESPVTFPPPPRRLAKRTTSPLHAAISSKITPPDLPLDYHDRDDDGASSGMSPTDKF